MLILIKTCCSRTSGPGSSPGIFNTNTKISEGCQTSNFRPRRLRFEPNERELSQLYGTVLNLLAGKFSDRETPLGCEFKLEKKYSSNFTLSMFFLSVFF